MNEEDLVENLGTIAKSGTRGFLSQLTGDAKKDSNLIGQFGVGFYSVFMVADSVDVTSRKAGDEKAWKWTSDGRGEFEITEDELDTNGTKVVLHLNDDGKEYANRWQLQEIVKKYSDHIAFPIYLRYTKTEYDDQGKEKGKEEKLEQINEASALWKQPKSELSDEDYKNFYKTISHETEDPLFWLHTKAEGTMEYTTLFYVPATAPFDMYQVDYRPGVKLYVQRVFITDDEKELMPTYLRFLRGDHRQRGSAAERQPRDPPAEQGHDQHPDREREEVPRRAAAHRARGQGALHEVHRAVQPAAQGGALPGLRESRDARGARPIQEHARGGVDEPRGVQAAHARRSEGDLLHHRRRRADAAQLAAARGVPEEGHRSPDHGRRLRRDRRPVHRQYKETELKPVNRADAGEDLKDEGDKEQEKKLEPVIDKIKAALGERVKDVRFSVRLADSPSCIVVDDADPTMQMQQLLKAMGQQEIPEVKPILEINPKHQIVSSLESASDDAFVEDVAFLLLDQALLVEGAPVKEPAEFVKRLNRVLSRAL